MTTLNRSTPPSETPSRKRRESWRKKAERHGVSTRTLDRWVAKGIIPAPQYINGRKYGDADAEPRIDAAE
jgi:hypothetical protein